METRNIRIGNKGYRVSSDDQYLAAMGHDFEPHMVQLFRVLVGEKDVVADIGANIGLTALLFSGLARQVYAFEPSPSTFKILHVNLDANGAHNVEAINLGLGQRAETLTITFAKNNRSGGFVSEKIRPSDGHMTEEICIDTLDNFFAANRQPPTFLKIDVEGFEQNVVKGGTGFLAKHKPTVVMEMNHFCLDVLQRITVPDFLDFMRSVFPVLYAIDTDNATAVDLHDPHKAYFVMHEHVVRHRFPNLVGGFSPEIKVKLDALTAGASGVTPVATRLQRAVHTVMNKLVHGQVFGTPPVVQGAGELHVEAFPETMSPGQAVEIAVTVTNKSRGPWHGYGSHPVLLSYHWLNHDGTTFQHDGLRTPLACETVPAGQALNEVVHVLAPEAPGRYQLVLTLVQEGVCWLEDKGFVPAMVALVVE